MLPNTRLNQRALLPCAAIAWLMLAVAGSLAADKGASQGPRGEVQSSILGKLPADFVVYAVGTYQGTTKLDNIQLDGSGHGVSQADVVVNLPDKPVVLVLTAYDPTVWRVGRTAKTRIAGVLVSGYHAQALIGIDKHTPSAISTYKKKGKFRYFYAYSASSELLAMNESVRSLVGREIDRFIYKSSKGVFHAGSPPKDAKEIIYSNDQTVKDFVEPNRPLAGQKGLDRLVQEGKLRLATVADIEAWVDKASAKYKRFNPNLSVSHYMRVGTTYVVLAELTLPNGLHGAHLRHFIIPQGMPFPKGPKCHNGFYLMDGTSMGTR